MKSFEEDDPNDSDYVPSEDIESDLEYEIDEKTPIKNNLSFDEE